MKLSEYQRRAAETDQYPKDGTKTGTGNFAAKSEIIPLLGLTGEVGSLLSEYKKLLRDGPVHLRFTTQVEEELGDLLWYIAAVATKFGLSLDSIARQNLRKVKDRWQRPTSNPRALDAGFPRSQQLPRKFRYTFSYRVVKRKKSVVLLGRNGQQIGDPLTDNSHEPDGYRFHDVMHFAFAALLGWSPVARRLLGRKRKKSARIDEIEDGGRAAVIEEAIVAMAFDYIEGRLRETADLQAVDTETLRSIRRLARGYEVRARTEREWETAILSGLEVWRQVQMHNGGTIVGDFRRRRFAFAAPAKKPAGEEVAPLRSSRRRGPASVSRAA
jgi:NTP pyrophosphatase (non-canonical NTP hydrolase)